VTDESWISKLQREDYAATNAVRLPFPMEWAVDGFLPSTGTSIWFGAGATGKTQLLLSLVAQIASPMRNEPRRWLGADVNACGRVLVLSAEDLQGDLMRRLGGIVASREPEVKKQEEICSRIQIIPFLSMTREEFRAKNPCLFWRGRDHQWTPTQTLIEIERYIDDWNRTASTSDKIVGVVMDSATTMAGFETTNAEATTNFLFYLNRLCVRLNVFWAIIGHTLKEAKVDPENPQENAVARLRGSAMWSTTPRSVVEVRLAHEQEDLGQIRGIDLRDIVVVSVVKANSHRAARHPRYLKRVDGAAYEDITHLGPKQRTSGDFASTYPEEDRARLLAVLTMLREMFASAPDRPRLTLAALTAEFGKRRGTTPCFEGMDGNPGHNISTTPRGGLAWCLQQIQRHGGLIYTRRGFNLNDLDAAQRAFEASE
jgi:hypothetical protein